MDRVEEAGERPGAAVGEVESHIGVIAAPERGELDGGVGKQVFGDIAAEKSAGSEQQDSHRSRLPVRAR
ncbi:hypothetical protein GCM10010390_55310 [Streptomyces mordarskii]|uniref:Uncharacterized protein n=1 Tax=Streptomyces mordarskii TaxID=1226758 RepID=A0ABN1DKZ1_9ACTN